jgi:hypothetical protein
LGSHLQNLISKFVVLLQVLINEGLIGHEVPHGALILSQIAQLCLVLVDKVLQHALELFYFGLEKLVLTYQIDSVLILHFLLLELKSVFQELVFS